jgi:hypothetical protein
MRLFLSPERLLALPSRAPYDARISLTMRFLLPLLVLAVLGAGCAQAPQNHPITPAAGPASVMPKNEAAVFALQEGRVPPHSSAPTRDGLGYSLIGESNCFGVESGAATGGSLLKTLAHPIENQRIRDQRDPGFVDAITPEVAKTLDERLVAITPTSSRFLASFVCQLRPDVHLVVGIARPLTEPTWNLSQEGMVTIPADLAYATYTSSTVVLLTDTRVQPLPNVRTWNAGGAPGGDPSPCTASLQGNAVLWTCGLGIGIDEAANATYPLGDQVYTISLKDGSVTSVVRK